MNWSNREEAKESIKNAIAEYYTQFLRKEEYIPGERIQYASTVFDERELCSAADALLDFWLGAGKRASEFERDFAKWLGVRFCSLVNSGSSANLLAVKALTIPELGDRRIMPGDEVITAACGFPTTVTAIINCGAVPVFLDVAIPQYNLDVSGLEEAYTSRTKAVMIAHTLGNPFDLAAIKAFCDKHNLWLIEDNCDALGAEYTIDGITKYTGTWGDIGTSSFYPPHHITMGEGGCVYTDNPVLHNAIVSFRDWGRDCVCPPGHDNFCGHRFDGQHGELPVGYDHKYVFSRFGFNLKITEIQAAIGCEQLKKLPYFIERRRYNWHYLRSALSPLESKLILPEPAENSNPSWFGFLLTVRDGSGLNRNKIVQYLEQNNIQTRLLFSGNYIRQPCFDGLRESNLYRVVGDLDNSDCITDNTFWIGVYPGMSNSMLDYMVKKIFEAVQQA